MSIAHTHPAPDFFLPPKEEELTLNPADIEIHQQRDALLVLSGGMDSTTMLYEFASRIGLALSFDYGSNHNARELQCAAWNCSHLGIDHLIIPLSFIGQYFRSSLLSGADAIPQGHYTAENMKSTVVPFRNGIMLAVAAGIAESRGLKTVMLANHAGDHAIYPDCRPAFVDAMGKAIETGSGDKVRLFCPYTHLTKNEICQRGVALGIDYHHTYSCYKGTEHHCGACGTCIERHEALASAGLNPADFD